MFTVEHRDDGIIGVITEDKNFTMEHWAEYQRVMLELLDDADEQIYILSDFRAIQLFASKLIYEVGTAKHLTHDKLGMLVLLGGNALTNFTLKMTEARATREDRNTKMRLHTEYTRAVNTLLHFRKIQTGESPSV
jgi:hypothetical protein